MSVMRSRMGMAAVLLALWLGNGLPPASPVATGEPPGRLGESLDLAAAAVTGPDSEHVSDDAYDLVRSGHREANVDSTASSSADCDGCSADATLVHVVYLDRPTETTLDNVAMAWSWCTDCRTTALSVQVVVLRSPQLVRANNRAMAVNVGCKGCLAAAAAFQLVVVGSRWERVSPGALDELRRWAAEKAAALRVEPSAGASPVGLEEPAEAALDQLEALVSEELGGISALERDADLQVAVPDPPADSAPDPVAGDRV